MAVGELMLILGLLVSAHCEVRARDPEVEDEEEELVGGRGSWGQEAEQQQNPFGLPEAVTAAPPEGEGSNYPARTGNWCAFVHHRVVTSAVMCGSEKYTIQSQSPCPTGSPDCQLVMYKLSTRPVYREKQRVFSALLWRCCPGHTGENCDDSVADGRVTDQTSALIGRYEAGSASEGHAHGELARLQFQGSDSVLEQNDSDFRNNTYTAQQPHHGDHHPNKPQPLPDNPHHGDHHPTNPHPLPDNPHHGDHHPTNPQPLPDNPHHGDHHPTNPQPLPDNPHHGDHHPTNPQALPDNPHHGDHHPTNPHPLPDNPHYGDHHPTNPHPLPDNPHYGDHHPTNPHPLPDNPHYGDHHPTNPRPLPDNPHYGDHHPTNPRPLPDNPHHRDHHPPNPRPLPDNPHHRDHHPPNPRLLPDNPHHGDHHPTNLHPSLPDNSHHGNRLHPSQDLHSPEDLDVDPPSHPDPASALPGPPLVALVLAQLQPVLEGFNRTLERLSRQVGDLVLDVAQLKGPPPGSDPEEAEGVPAPGGPDPERRRAEKRNDEAPGPVEEVRRLLESHRAQVEERLLSQHATLRYNLTSWGADVDLKLKRSHKTIQTSLHKMNASLAELRMDHDRLGAELQVGLLELHLARPGTPAPPDAPHGSPDVWDAIERLNDKVVNHTVMLDALDEDLRLGSGVLEDRIIQTGRNSQIQFMETVLEVEAARVVVLTRVEELMGDLNATLDRMQDIDVGVEDLYGLFNKNTNECTALRAELAHLERGVANATELANKNHLALDARQRPWGEAGDWEPAVRELQISLQQVRAALAFEQGRTRTLHTNLTQLAARTSREGGEQSLLRLEEEMRRLSGSFTSLISDVVRHRDVLRTLLGEGVLDFLELSPEAQEALSVPALRRHVGRLEERLDRHNLSIAALLAERRGDRADSPETDQPSSPLLPPAWSRRGGAPSREKQLLRPSGDSDPRSVEQEVQELGVKVQQLEERPCPASCGSVTGAPGGQEAALQAEVLWLRRGLEEHLRVFKNVFRNADGLMSARSSLDLEELRSLLREREGKREKRRGGERRRGGGVQGAEGGARSRRDTAPAGGQLLFLARAAPGNPGNHGNGTLRWEVSLGRGGVLSETGRFTAPVGGAYLFALTLDTAAGGARSALKGRSGETLAVLHREEATGAGPLTRLGFLLLEEGEEAAVELGEEGAALFAGLLLL